jgi:hypothetical protein
MRITVLSLYLLTILAGCSTPDLAYKNPETEARWKRLERALADGTLSNGDSFVGQQVHLNGLRTGVGSSAMRILTGPKRIDIIVLVDRSPAARRLSRATAKCLTEVEQITAPFVYVSVSGIVTKIDPKHRTVYLAPHLMGVTSSF